MIERFFARHMAGFGKLGALFELGRPWNGLIIGLVAILGYYMMSPAPSALYALIIFFAFIFVYAAGTTLNDIFDFDADKINMPYRPLQSGRATIQEAYLFALFFYIASIVLALYVGIELVFSIALFIILGLTYSLPPFRIVDRGIAANVNLALVTIFIPAYAGATVALYSFSVPSSFLFSFISFTALFVFASMIKDLKDITGDRKHGKKTFAVMFGKRNTILSAVAGTVVFFPLTTHLISAFFDYSFLLYALSLPIFLMLILTETYKTEGYEQKIEDERFGKVRLVLLPYVLLLLILSAFPM